MSGGLFGLCFWGPFAVLSSFVGYIGPGTSGIHWPICWALLPFYLWLCGLSCAGHIGDSLASFLGPVAALFGLWGHSGRARRGVIGLFFGPFAVLSGFAGFFGLDMSGTHWAVLFRASLPLYLALLPPLPLCLEMWAHLGWLCRALIGLFCLSPLRFYLVLRAPAGWAYWGLMIFFGPFCLLSGFVGCCGLGRSGAGLLAYFLGSLCRFIWLRWLRCRFVWLCVLPRVGHVRHSLAWFSFVPLPFYLALWGPMGWACWGRRVRSLGMPKRNYFI